MSSDPPKTLSIERVLIGGGLGLLSSVIGTLLVWFAGMIVLWISQRDLLTVGLAGITFLPIMLIVVFTPPNALLGALTGCTLALTAGLRKRSPGWICSALVGIVFAEVLFSLVLRLIVKPSSGDFVSIITRPGLTAIYGGIVGMIAGVFVRRII